MNWLAAGVLGLVATGAACGAWSALGHHLVHELVNVTIDLRMRGVLERCRNVISTFAMRLRDLRQRLARQLGAQLVGRNANRLRGGVQALLHDARRKSARPTRPLSSTLAVLRVRVRLRVLPSPLRYDPVHKLVNAVVELGMRGGLQRVGDIARVLAVIGRYLRQRLALQLSAQLLGRDANGLRRGLELKSQGKAARPARSSWARAARETAIGGQPGTLPRLADVRLELLR